MKRPPVEEASLRKLAPWGKPALGSTPAPWGKPQPPPARRGRWRWLRRGVTAGVLVLVWGGLALALAFLWLVHDLPRPEEAHAQRRPSLTLLDREGTIFARYGDTVGDIVRLRDLPPFIAQAAVAVEDRRFWSHGALDGRGLARAALIDLRARRIVQGGSTLSQQVAKTLFLNNSRTWRRKFQEVLLTFWVYDHFSRAEILEIWLNRVYLGAGAYGVDAAAKVYFGVPARKLTLWQAALIVGLARAPARFNPHANPEAAAARARQVLAAMVETGAISAQQGAAAMSAIALPAHPLGVGGWFADWAAEQAETSLPDGQDSVLRTTLDLRAQQAAERDLAAALAGPGRARGVSEGAVVALDAASGAVRVMVGGTTLAEGGFNRATRARRQPGSAFKPFVWLTALAHGETPDTLVEDAPLRLGGWAPADIEHRYAGAITLTQALAQSSNTAAVRLLLRSGGPDAVIATARRLGIQDALPRDASLALGTASVGLLELTASYAPFFNGGYRITPQFRPSAAPSRQAVLRPEQALMMRRMLEAVVTTGTGRAAALPGMAVAGKTGTSQDYRDAWFIGGTAGGGAGGVLVGVWFGNDDGAPMRGVTGGGLPARLAREVLDQARALPPLPVGTRSGLRPQTPLP